MADKQPPKQSAKKKLAETPAKPTNKSPRSEKPIENKRSNNSRTRIVVQFDVGFKNSLYLRGHGIANLNWEKGLELKNTKANEWVWETDVPFNDCEFKILINDKTYEIGENHLLHCGSSVRINPKFPGVQPPGQPPA